MASNEMAYEKNVIDKNTFIRFEAGGDGRNVAQDNMDHTACNKSLRELAKEGRLYY